MSGNRNRSGIAAALRELEKDQQRVRAQIEKFVAQVQSDPISALKIRFTPSDGFTSTPFQFKGEILSGAVNLLEPGSQVSGGTWTPPSHGGHSTTVEPVGVLHSRWGMMVAFRVSYEGPDGSLKLQDLMRSSDPSSVYIVDPVNAEYLSLIASSLEGEVLPGMPRTGILAFAYPTGSTDRVQICFSDVSFASGRDARSSFSFEYADQELPAIIQQVNTQPRPLEAVDDLLHQEVDKLRRQFLSQQAGCASNVILFFASILSIYRNLLS